MPPLFAGSQQMGIAQDIVDRGARMLQALQGVAYGMTRHEIVLYAVRLRAGMEHLFILVTVGDLIGLPILPPYYSLRLLPYLVPQIATWKRQILRERDFIEAEGLDLLG
jgi:hypothetical protein